MGAIQLDRAIDLFLADWQAEGRLRSEHSIRAYRECLELHAVDVGNRDPGKTGKRDVQRTLRRWGHPNTQGQKYAILRSFYRWAVYEELRASNPVDQVRPPRPAQPEQQRLTREESVRLVAAADPVRRERTVSSAPLYRERIRSRNSRTDYSRPGGPLRADALRVPPIYVRAETGHAPCAPVETIS